MLKCLLFFIIGIVFFAVSSFFVEKGTEVDTRTKKGKIESAVYCALFFATVILTTICLLLALFFMVGG